MGVSQVNRLVFSSILVLFLIVLSGFVMADYTIESLDFKAGENVVTHVLPKHSQVVNIVMNVSTNESLDLLTADLTEVNPNPTKFLSYQNYKFICTGPTLIDDSDYYSCRANSIIFIPQNETVYINFSLTGDTTQNILYEKTFTIDDTNPQLETFETEYCVNEKCFIANRLPTKLYFSFEDSIATFYQEKIFYSIGDSTSRRVTSCAGNTCEGIYTETNCDSGDRLEAVLTKHRTLVR